MGFFDVSSILMQGAANNAQQAAQRDSMVTGFFDKLAKSKEFDVEKEIEGAKLAAAQGKPFTERQMIAVDVYDRGNSDKIVQNPITGDMYNPYVPLAQRLGMRGSMVDNLAQLPRVQAKSQYDAPMMAESDMAPAPQGGASMPVPAQGQPLPMYIDDGSIPPMNVEDINNALSGSAVGNQVQSGSQMMGNSPASAYEAAGLPMPVNDKQAQELYQAQLDIQKAGAVEEQKKKAALDITKESKKIEQTAQDSMAIPVIERMIARNDKTLNIPYAEALQGVSRAIPNKDIQDHVNNIDLIKQDQITLAAPLAKMLGVNPTDKDFKATLESIVNLNASPESRKLQLENLSAKIKDRTISNMNDLKNFASGNNQQNTPVNRVRFEDLQ